MRMFHEILLLSSRNLLLRNQNQNTKDSESDMHVMIVKCVTDIV